MNKYILPVTDNYNTKYYYFNFKFFTKENLIKKECAGFWRIKYNFNYNESN